MTNEALFEILESGKISHLFVKYPVDIFGSENNERSLLHILEDSKIYILQATMTIVCQECKDKFVLAVLNETY